MSATKLNSLASLANIEIEYAPVPEQAVPMDEEPERKDYNEFINPAYNVVSIAAYLIGVPATNFKDNSFGYSAEKYNELNRNQACRIIRNLCIVRNGIECHYSQILQAFRDELKNITTVPEYISVEAVSVLEQDGINLYRSRPDIVSYIIEINSHISNRIANALSVFPEWLNREYIKPLFLMKNGTKPEGIKAAGDEFNSDRNRYPFHCWLNWNALSLTQESKGNVLFNDEKFVTMLYECHHDRLENLSLVREVGNKTMRNLSMMLEHSSKCVVVVDCENSDAIKLAAALSALSKDLIGVIDKIILFDDEHTTPQWETMVDRFIHIASREADIDRQRPLPIEHIMVDRLLQSKSQVDMTLSTRTCTEVMKNGADSVILVSSDSDYWALINGIGKDAKFLVMLERDKTSTAIMDTMAQNNIPFCFIDDFCTSASYSIKSTTLINEIQSRIDAVLQGESARKLNMKSLLDDALQESWIQMTPHDKQAFYDRYLKRVKLIINEDGQISIPIEQ